MAIPVTSSGEMVRRRSSGGLGWMALSFSICECMRVDVRQLCMCGRGSICIHNEMIACKRTCTRICTHTIRSSPLIFGMSRNLKNCSHLRPCARACTRACVLMCRLRRRTARQSSPPPTHSRSYPAPACQTRMRAPRHGARCDLCSKQESSRAILNRPGPSPCTLALVAEGFTASLTMKCKSTAQK